MRVLAFGLPHFERFRAQARDLSLPLEFVGAYRRPLNRLGRLRAFFPLRREATRAIGVEMSPEEEPRIAWGTAEIVWRRVERADAVAVWNGSRGHGLAAVLAAVALGKPIVYVENGFLPDTVQIDRKGINFASSLAELDPQSLPETPPPPLAFRQRPLGKDTGADAVCDAVSDLPPGFILYAAQVHDDSQILRFSPDFPTVDDAIRYVAAECAALDVPLVVKEHPQDHGRIDRAALKAELPEVRFLENAGNADLIADCRAFVTINSSLALQAVDADKPVFTLGDAAYNHPGIAHRVRPQERLRDALQNANFASELRHRYLAYLANEALLPFHWREPSDEELRALAKRIAEIL